MSGANVKKTNLLNPIVMLAEGLVLGALSRVFDIYCQVLGEIFSQMAIWVLLGTSIVIYSPAATQKAGRKTAAVTYGDKKEKEKCLINQDLKQRGRV